mgnify:FL=1
MQNDAEKLKGDVHIPTKDMFSRIYRYLKPEMARFVGAMLLILLNVVLDIILPLFVSQITNNLKSDGINVEFIVGMAVAYLAIGVFNQAFLVWESMLLQKAGQNIIYTLRNDVFSHIEQLSQNQFDEMPVGSLVTRVASYTASMSDLFTNVIVNVIKNVLTVVGVYGIMLYISWQLSLVMLAFIVVVFITSFVFRNVVKKVFTKERQYISDLNTFLNENLSGMKLIQIFNRQQKKELEFLEKNENLRKSRYKVVLAFGIYRPFITLLYISSIAVTFWLGMEFGLDAGMIVAFYLYLSRFFNPIQNLADQLNNLQKAITASERLFNLLDVKPEIRDREDAVTVDKFDGKIEFKNVWFAYKGEDWILKDMSFTINPKETCAFVGATGAGKTTILSLIVRNYEIQKGQILIDGRDISTIDIHSLRKGIGQMLQDVFLFSGTVRSNITLNDESFGDEEIEAACKYVNADTFISSQEHGLDEEVIERGENFSQGQRQLLSFARTVLHKPQILILDEATANIDTETEVVIQKSLENIRNIGTMLVVAHRLSTIQHADQIIVLQNGRIIEKGTHQQLLKNKGYYHKLYELQFENRD